MNTDPIYEADGKISVRKAVPFGLQHVLAMFVANIAPILIVTGVVKIPASEAGAIVQAAMIIAGIGSLLQMYPVFRLGSGLPVIMGISFTFVSVFCVIGLKYGYGAILGCCPYRRCSGGNPRSLRGMVAETGTAHRFGDCRDGHRVFTASHRGEFFWRRFRPS